MVKYFHLCPKTGMTYIYEPLMMLYKIQRQKAQNEIRPIIRHHNNINHFFLF